MGRYKYILVSILSFILLPITIKGAVCSNSDKVNYQALAKNISVSYDYTEENENTRFNLTFTNIPTDFYIKDMNSKQTYPYTGSEMTISSLEQGKSFKFGIYTTNSGCDSILLYTHYITFPYYNPYYNNELCNNIKNFNYCNKWVNKKVTFEEFRENVEKYKARLDRTNTPIEEEEEFSLLDVLINFYLKYYFIILPVIIVIGGIIIRRHNKKQDLF